MSKTFFIADLHFGSEAIIRYENRPFANALDMERNLISNWNSVVSDNDIVYVLGDFSTGSEENDRFLLSMLRGTKILIMGNHDMHRTPAQWRDLGFLECSPWPIVYNNFYILSHEPMYVNTNMPYANIFGHVHSNTTYNTISPQSACVSVERINYTPIDFDLLAEKIKEFAK